VVTGAKVQQEQLGDLKLYRVPERTTVASRQSKQVRLMDRDHIPVTTMYGFDVSADDDEEDSRPAHRLLRTQNTLANQLGLPLPSGSVAVYGQRDGGTLLQHESKLKDLAATGGRLYGPAYAIYRAVRLGINPYSALLNEFSGRLAGTPASSLAQESLP